ncbi:Gmad2 immunoglobulin-like domain-containing protein [Patescibacteria group bacterium]|nr:Gmad2 immunoglobulin-like domain-containing protein [Patescibacteria group bacterium]
MQQTPTILIGIIIGLTLLFLIIFSYLTKGKDNNSSHNYKSIFVIGLTWLPIGVAIDVVTFSIIGLIFLIIGVANKDKWGNERKWSELDTKSRVIKLIVLGLGIILLLYVGILYIKSVNKSGIIIKDFNSCMEAGNPIMESYPRQCSDGENHFVENIGNIFEVQNLIELNSVRPNDKISSPLVLEGQAVGSWYFEGSFPVVLTDWDGLIIAEGYVTAHPPAGEDWMTEDFVQFKGELEFEKPDFDNRGTLILRKDNPSGLPEHDNVLEIPVLFE